MRKGLSRRDLLKLGGLSLASTVVPAATTKAAANTPAPDIAAEVGSADPSPGPAESRSGKKKPAKTHAPLQVGASQADITPSLPVDRGGSFKSMRADRVLTPLTAQSIAIRQGNEAFIWTSVDVGNVGSDRAVPFRERVAAATGLSPHQIHLSATHCHGAPTGPMEFSLHGKEEGEQEKSRIYTVMMEKAADSAIRAFNAMRPANMGYGQGNAPRACFNRRFIMSNGRSEMQGRSATPGVYRTRIEGPVDDQLQAVWFTDAQSGQYIAVMVNFATHPNQTSTLPAICADFPGEMRSTITQALGKDFPILFLQGACGNIQHVDLESSPRWGRGLDGLKTVGRYLASEVLKILHASWPQPSQTIELATTHTQVELTFREFPPQEVDRVMSVIRQAAELDDPWTLLNQQFPTLADKANAKAIGLIDTLRRKHGLAETLPLSGIRLGDVHFVLTPAHQFVEYQLALKAAFPGQKVMVVDFTDGGVNYVPTEVAIALGGYEPQHRRYTSDAGQRILTKSIEIVEQLQAGGPGRRSRAV